MPMNGLAGARRRVARWLVDECTIAGAPGPAVYDAELEEETLQPGDEVWSGPCRVNRQAGDNVVNVGEGVTTLRRYDVTVPFDVVVVEVDHIVTISTSTDPYLVGRPLRVVDVQGSTDAAYRRLVCEDVLAGGIEVGS